MLKHIESFNPKPCLTWFTRNKIQLYITKVLTQSSPSCLKTQTVWMWLMNWYHQVCCTQLHFLALYPSFHSKHIVRVYYVERVFEALGIEVTWQGEHAPHLCSDDVRPHAQNVRDLYIMEDVVMVLVVMTPLSHRSPPFQIGKVTTVKWYVVMLIPTLLHHFRMWWWWGGGEWCVICTYAKGWDGLGPD